MDDTVPRRDIYRLVTERIIAAIEIGAGVFEMPWHRDTASGKRPHNALTGNPYHGINVIALWTALYCEGFTSHLWATYRQWQTLGAQVRRGQKANPIVFYKDIEKEGEDEANGEPTREKIRIARASFVFNADQVDGWAKPKESRPTLVEAIDHAEEFVRKTSARIREGGDRAYYSPALDFIQMPERSRFKGSSPSTPTEAYYSTAFHELTHWSGHPSRLNRNLSSRFGDQAYAIEELVAEFGAAFLCADLFVSNVPRQDHAAYIQSWLAVLRKDAKALFTAAAIAGRAAMYLLARPDGE